MDAAPHFRLRLLGGFLLQAEGATEPLRISSRKGRALVAYLAMQPSYRADREQLAALLWGDSNDRQARQSLRQCLLALRQELQEQTAWLIIGHDSVGLDEAMIEVDSRAFLALARSEVLGDLSRAADLYGGPFLDCLRVDADGFGAWVDERRSELTAAAAHVFQQCAMRHDRDGNGSEAIHAAERLAALDPLSEPTQRLLLHLLVRHRGRHAAYARARDFAAALRSELGVEPEPETAHLIESLRSGEGVAPRDRSSRAAKLIPGSQAVLARGSGAPSSPAVLTAAAVLATMAIVGIFLARELLPSSDATDRALSWRSPPVPGDGKAPKAALPAQPIVAVAVLPFTVEGGERSPDALLADRITGDLIGDLSRVPGLRVIARQTSRLYADRPVDVATVGAELGVRYVVEGSVRLNDRRARIDISLVDAATRLRVWSDRFDREQEEIGTLQDELTRGLARRLQVNVALAEDRRRALRADASESEVSDLVARGWAAIIRMIAGDRTAAADQYFEAALKRDPDNVSALSGLGAYHTQAVAMFLVSDPVPHIVRSQELLARAIERDPWHMISYFYLGTLDKARGRPHDALRHFAKAVELNPSYAPAYGQIGHVLSRMGQLDEAMEHVRYAIRLSPKDHSVGIWTLFGGQIALERGRDAEALEWLKRAAELAPRNAFAHATLAAAFAVTGDAASAARHAAETRTLAPWLTLEHMTARIVGQSEQETQPRRLIEGLRLAFAAR